ncbi:mitochondrial genome maintenance protein [Kwoniella heveanensis BCC8398]|uniref:Mitochondrial genome maintenance protein MGM101 n=1 Tax=Kwoniella heveanensis BCC8398 TaxID=1296120 RepID=A0A1B9H4J7_9TREE|nr:mitochondrial genome maintenance protein [Kwoniella heveanensis BCC8398]
MSMLSTSIRQTPGLSALRLVQVRSRALSTSRPIYAASAPSPTAASTTRYVRKTPVAASASASSSRPASSSYSKPSPSSSTTYAPRSTYNQRKPASSSPSPSSSVSRAAPASRSSAPLAQDAYDDEFPLPSSEPLIDDYAHLSPSSSAPTPTPSPPLTSLPGEGYQPLPTVEGSASKQGLGQGQGIQGEAPVLNAVGNSSPATPTSADWSTSFAGLSERPFDRETAEALLRPLSPQDVEIKPDGLLYLPEIKYRRTLNAAFGPGGWGLAPRGETHVGPRIVSREWGLVCLGRLVSVARGEQEYFDPSGIPTATEACKSNALMRCCKDLGIASELWDPTFIRDFKKNHCVEVFTEHAMTKKKKKLWRKRDSPKFDYPWKEGL